MNIQSFLEKHRVSTAGSEHHHVGIGWIGVDCPYCSPNAKKFRLGFELSTGRCNCWKCGRQNGAATLARVARVPIGEVLAWWDDLGLGVKSPDIQKQGELKLPSGLCDLLPIQRKYLEDREFDPDEIERLWGIKGIEPGHRLGLRIWIPIHNIHGEVVSWTTRAADDSVKSRYISAAPDEESVNHKTLLYGAHLARHVAVVVEGPIDAWAIGPGGVATFGTAITSSQWTAIMGYPVKAICLDPDAMDRRDGEICRMALTEPIDFVHLETGDPADADKEEIAELRRTYFGFAP